MRGIYIYIYIYMEVNDRKESDRMEKIEKNDNYKSDESITKVSQH